MAEHAAHTGNGKATLIRTVGLRKVYTTEEVETTALDNVNLEIADGEFAAVMGPSGCGKSTLLNLLGLLDNPTGGEYWLLEEEVSTYSERLRANLRKGTIGFVFQSYNLINELTVHENVELPLLYMGLPGRERRERVRSILDRMQITHRGKHFPQQLSGGQQQRVAVARALVSEPKLVLADEPTGNLDSRHGDEVMEMLTGINRYGTTVVMVTHSPAYADFAHRVIHLFDGRIATGNTAGGQPCSDTT